MKKYSDRFFTIIATGAFLFFGGLVVAAQNADALSAEPSKKIELPTAEAVLANYLKAIGGSDAGRKFKSRTSTGKVEIVQAGASGTLVGHAMADHYSYVKMSIPGLGDFTEGFDGTTGWANDPIQGFREKRGEELAQNKSMSRFNREFDIKSDYTRLEVTGTESVDGNETYVIKGTKANKEVDLMYFEKKTGLLTRLDTVLITPAGKTPITNLYSDYRDLDGIKYSFRTVSKTPQFDIVIQLDDVKHNVEIDKKIFSPPSAK